MTQAVLARARKVTPTGRKQKTYRLPLVTTYIKFRKFRFSRPEFDERCLAIQCVIVYAYQRHIDAIYIYLTIRLCARDFYRMIVDEAEGRIKNHS